MNNETVRKHVEDYEKGFILLMELHTTLFESALKINPTDIINSVPKKYKKEFFDYAKRLIAEDYNSWVCVKMNYNNEAEEKEINKKLYEKWKSWDEQYGLG
jgi:hypothetical protein